MGWSQFVGMKGTGSRSSPHPCQEFPCSQGTRRATGMCPRVPFSLGTQTRLPGASRLALDLRPSRAIAVAHPWSLLPGGAHHQGLMLLSSSPRFGGRRHLRPCPQPRRGHSWGPPEQPAICASGSSATVIKIECCFPASRPPGGEKPAPGRSRLAASRVCKRHEGLANRGSCFRQLPCLGKVPSFPQPPHFRVRPGLSRLRRAPPCLHPGDLHGAGGLETPQPGCEGAVGEGPAPGPP